jgi:putative transposase
MTRPQRKLLPHVVPAWVREQDAVFFITICCDPRSQNQLCNPLVAAKLFESVAFRHNRGDLWMHLVLLMPDHLHALASFPQGKDMRTVVTQWKKYVAREFHISWQRDFFDHRLRNDESLLDKEDYIRMNPVRVGLVARPEDWPYVWEPAPR